MQLTAYTSSAGDGYFLIGTKEFPDLVARASSIKDIPEAVRSAAAVITGHDPNDIDVIVGY
jgi:predicted RNase H-like HicB family nuclease